MSEALVGGVVDTRYELRRLIARGGMGLVFEAHHQFTRRTVALKLLSSQLRAESEAHSRLLREAHALTAARHPGLVEVLDAGVCGRHGPYLVLEMLEGRTLDGILAARRRLTIEDTVQVGRQLCAAVGHAHGHGVIHRDIKPSNVFVARNELGQEAVKLIDLGVAAVAEDQLGRHDKKLTTANAVIGTPEYMAPEQLWGHDVDARSDVYAIGMTLYECLSGEVPYAGTYPEVLVRVSNSVEPPRIRDKRADVTPALALVIEHALEKEAGARFQTAAELGRALMAASGFMARASSLLGALPEEPAARAAQLERPPQAPPPLRTQRQGAGHEPGERANAAPLRRRFVRAPFVTPVIILLSTGSQIEARCEELSEEGMLVVSPLSFPLGAEFRLRFASPMTGEMVTTSATVRWTREGRERTAIGVEFVEPPPALRSAVAGYIALLPSAQG